VFGPSPRRTFGARRKCATFIHEAQTLDALATGDAPGAQNVNNTLKVFRANASYMPSTRLNFTLGYFNTTGTSDVLLYPASSSYDGAGRDAADNNALFVFAWLAF
jgi:hypothetical protein